MRNLESRILELAEFYYIEIGVLLQSTTVTNITNGQRMPSKILSVLRNKTQIAGCWDCSDFYIGKTKRWLQDRKTELFRALTKNDPTSAIADHIKATGHNIKWDILASVKTDYHCKIKETLLVQELKTSAVRS